MIGIGSKQMTARDRAWQAEEDARTLARAEEVRSDPKRMGAARKQAAAEVVEKKKELAGMQKIARQPGPARKMLLARKPK